MIFLVSHAHVDEKLDVPDDVELQPLSMRGLQEAAGLGRRLSGFDLTSVFSSPALPCVQTVDQLAHDRHLPLRLDRRLRPDARPADVLQLATADGVVLCAGDDLIRGVLDHLRAHGVDVPDDAECATGSIWLLDIQYGTVNEAVYLPPLWAPVRVSR